MGVIPLDFKSSFDWFLVYKYSLKIVEGPDGVLNLSHSSRYDSMISSFICKSNRQKKVCVRVCACACACVCARSHLCGLMWLGQREAGIEKVRKWEFFREQACMYTHVCMCIYARARAFVRKCSLHVRVSVCRRAVARACVRDCVLVCERECSCVCACWHGFTCVRTCACVYVYFYLSWFVACFFPPRP